MPRWDLLLSTLCSRCKKKKGKTHSNLYGRLPIYHNCFLCFLYARLNTTFLGSRIGAVIWLSSSQGNLSKNASCPGIIQFPAGSTLLLSAEKEGPVHLSNDAFKNWRDPGYLNHSMEELPPNACFGLIHKWEFKSYCVKILKFWGHLSY